MNWNPTNEPTNNNAPRLARTSGADRRMPRRTSGAADRRSTTVNKVSSTTPPASVVAVCTQRHIRQPHDAEHEQQHGRRQADGAGDVEPPRRRRRRVEGRQRRATARRPRRQHRGEEDPAPVDRGEQSAGDHAEREAAGRCGRRRRAAPGCVRSPSSKLVVMIDRLAGVRNPALTPVAKRARISTQPDGASPPSPEKAMNTTSERGTCVAGRAGRRRVRRAARSRRSRARTR